MSTQDKPITPNHPLYPTHRHCYHQITCGASPLRHRRHDDLARLVAHHLGSEAGLDASITALPQPTKRGVPVRTLRYAREW